VEQRVSLITLGVADLAPSRRFYEALGWSAVTEQARKAGATIGREPGETFWGGYDSIVIDPDGHPWEIAHNPGWTVNADRSVTI
jgi:uncharacterized glyoxalase superfamily protein PhnB